MTKQRWITGLCWIALVLGFPVLASAQIRGELTGGTNLESITIDDAVYLAAWLQVLKTTDTAKVELRAKEIYSNVQGTLKTLPSVANADFTGDGNVDINDAVLLVGWLQVFKNSNPLIVKGRAKEIYSNFEGDLKHLPSTFATLSLSSKVTGVSLGSLAIRISGGSNVDYATYTTSTEVTAGGASQTLTKSENATNAAFPNKDGVVLNFSGFLFNTVDEFASLTFSNDIPIGASVEVLNGNALVAKSSQSYLPGAGPVLKLESAGTNLYKVSLLSPVEYQTKGLAGVSNVGVICPGFSGLTGMNGYSPTALGFQSNQSISFVDLSAERKLAGASIDLYTFSCSSKPSFKLGETVAVTYVGLSPITGSNNVSVVNP